MIYGGETKTFGSTEVGMKIVHLSVLNLSALWFSNSTVKILSFRNFHKSKAILYQLIMLTFADTSLFADTALSALCVWTQIILKMTLNQ